MNIKQTQVVQITPQVGIGGNRRFTLIAGPCAIESEEMAFQTAYELKRICKDLDIPFVFKASFDKANRTSLASPRGVGMEKGLEILAKIKRELDLPILTDVHEPSQCSRVAEVADVLQIPAFLCRQTDLLIAAAKTGKVVNVKKGQFLAPWDMKNVLDKLEGEANYRLLLCERGSCFGYNNLVVDMTGLAQMREYGYPVVFDATHSVQKPGGSGQTTGGNRDMAPYLMRAALAVGVDGLFVETHPNPDYAWSDGPNQIFLKDMYQLLSDAVRVDNVVKANLSAESLPVMKSLEGKRIVSKVKLLLTDVDGVMTNGGMYYSADGDSMKRFHVHDGMGLQLLKAKGVKVGIITSEDNQIVRKRFEKLRLDFLVQGKRNEGKLAAAKSICDDMGIDLSEVAYIGDDINCRELLQHVGLAACPADAMDVIKSIPGIVLLKKKGGEGCVREFVELIIKHNEE